MTINIDLGDDARITLWQKNGEAFRGIAILTSAGGACTTISLTNEKARALLDAIKSEMPNASNLPPHQARVIDEEAELHKKTVALFGFLDTPIYAGLSAEERWRLACQFKCMTDYRSILRERIAAFKTETVA